MITQIEVDADGVKRRVFHRAGNITVDGVVRRDERYVWTHPYESRNDCDACMKGLIPASVKKGENE